MHDIPTFQGLETTEKGTISGEKRLCLSVTEPRREYDNTVWAKPLTGVECSAVSNEVNGVNAIPSRRGFRSVIPGHWQLLKTNGTPAGSKLAQN
jgi:hypothetical protein